MLYYGDAVTRLRNAGCHVEPGKWRGASVTLVASKGENKQTFVESINCTFSAQEIGDFLASIKD